LGYRSLYTLIMNWTILIALFLIVCEAVYEGLAVRGKHLASELIEDIYTGLIIVVVSLWLATVTDIPLWKIITGIVMIRFALFDIIWNISAGQRWFYYGNKLYDRIMISLGGWGWFVKAICLIVGICILFF